MSKFKVGDRVKLVNLKSPYGGLCTSKSNTIGNVGVIVRVVKTGLPWVVKWDNGSANSYYEDNLSKLLLNMRNK